MFDIITYRGEGEHGDEFGVVNLAESLDKINCIVQCAE